VVKIRDDADARTAHRPIQDAGHVMISSKISQRARRVAPLLQALEKARGGLGPAPCCRRSARQDCSKRSPARAKVLVDVVEIVVSARTDEIRRALHAEFPERCACGVLSRRCRRVLQCEVEMAVIVSPRTFEDEIATGETPLATRTALWTALRYRWS